MSAIGYITLRFPISIETDGGTRESPPEDYLYAGQVQVIDHSIPDVFRDWFDRELRSGDVFCDFIPSSIADTIGDRTTSESEPRV